MTMGGICSGIGGFEYAATRLGMDVRWMAEIEPYCQRVLRKHWPAAPIYGDIREVDWNAVEPVELLCGGPPCQPASVAGKRLGEADDRWLWPEVHRAVAALKPRWCCFENPPGLLGVGLHKATAPMESLGYEVGVASIPACAVGAPHLRERLWIVAHANRERELQPKGGIGHLRRWACNGASATVNPDADGGNGDGRNGALQVGRERCPENDACRCGSGGDERGAQPGVRGVDARLPARLDGDWFGEFPEPLALGVPHRTERVSALGNSVVPQVAAMVLRAILAAEDSRL